ncbi:MAG: diacylglycerol kinase [Pseudomonadota bacterium]
MNADRRQETEKTAEQHEHLKQRSAVPGKGGLSRIAASFSNTLGGLREGILTEAAIKQEVAIAAVAVPLSFFVADSLWVWVALIASLLLVLAVEFLNTAIERLCNHLHPDVHEAIRATKDLASAGVFFALTLAGLVWGAALLSKLGFF